jgi:hypothetical protein
MYNLTINKKPFVSSCIQKNTGKWQEKTCIDYIDNYNLRVALSIED